MINAKREEQLKNVEGNARAEARVNQQADKEIEAIQKQRAEREKRLALAGATVDYLSGLIAIWSQWAAAPPVAAALSAGLSAVYLTNVAKIISAPAFKDGVSNFEGGLAWVGDGGESELVIGNGFAFMSPDKPTLMNLPGGTDVLNQKQMKATGYTELLNHQLLSQMSPIVEERLDNRQMMRKLDAINSSIKKVKVSASSNITGDGIETIKRHGNSTTKYIKRISK
jgi:hypothetical protein